MKIRSGFVSNSSSSSFICSSTLDLKTAEEKLRVMLKAYNELYNEDLKFETVFDKPFRVSKNKKSLEYKDFIADWIFKGDNAQYAYGVNCDRDLDGKLIINSKEDNSVPYALFDLIQDLFQGTRIHLG